jgi:hypothetical protein
MTTSVLTPLTARLFLFGKHEEDAATRMGKAVEEGGVGGAVAGAVGGLTRAGRHAVCDEVGHTADRLLDLDLGDLVAAAWRKHAALRAAGRRTAAAPGTEELVELATHKITSTHRPYVEVFVDDVEVTRVDLQLQLTFVVKGVLAVVRDGRLVAVRTGSCDASAALSCEGVKVASRKATLDLPAIVRLGSGVSLVVDADPAPPG